MGLPLSRMVAAEGEQEVAEPEAKKLKAEEGELKAKGDYDTGLARTVSNVSVVPSSAQATKTPLRPSPATRKQRETTTTHILDMLMSASPT